jgi:hypothetical protein
MRQFIVTVMALAALGALVATAQADYTGGAPLRNGDQCFNYIEWGEKDGRFGSWAPCPQPASKPNPIWGPRRAACRTRAQVHRAYAGNGTMMDQGNVAIYDQCMRETAPRCFGC